MAEPSGPVGGRAEAFGPGPWEGRIGQGQLSESPTRHLGGHARFPGLVILSDVYYPGWQLTIDDEPATIYRVNGAMACARSRRSASPRLYLFTTIVSGRSHGVDRRLGRLASNGAFLRVSTRSFPSRQQRVTCPQGTPVSSRDVSLALDRPLTLALPVFLLGGRRSDRSVRFHAAAGMAFHARILNLDAISPSGRGAASRTSGPSTFNVLVRPIPVVEKRIQLHRQPASSRSRE